MPDVTRLVDDRLDYVWPNDGRRAIRQSEQAKELRFPPKKITGAGRVRIGYLDIDRSKGCTYHEVEPRWAKIGHHRLRK
jgi:hypothetical protein